MQTTGLAKQVVRELFTAYLAAPHELPASFGVSQDDVARALGAAAGRVRNVADYIAGMTDRFAAREHERLSGRRLLG
jgi:dGTPase